MPTDDVKERARKIVRKFPQIEPYVIGPLLQGCIAQALTEAHDAGTEEAAGIAGTYGSFIADDIRRAKSTEQV